MKCPFCKYEPIYKKDNTPRLGYLDFVEMVVYGETHEDYLQRKTKLGYICPKCGIHFSKIEE